MIASESHRERLLVAWVVTTTPGPRRQVPDRLHNCAPAADRGRSSARRAGRSRAARSARRRTPPLSLSSRQRSRSAFDTGHQIELGGYRLDMPSDLLVARVRRKSKQTPRSSAPRAPRQPVVDRVLLGNVAQVRHSRCHWFAVYGRFSGRRSRDTRQAGAEASTCPIRLVRSGRAPLRGGR